MFKKITYSLIGLIFIMTAVLSFNVLAEDYDLGGRTVTVGYLYDLGERMFSEPEEVSWLEEVEEEFNVNIEFATYENIEYAPFTEELAMEVMSGESEIDLYVMNNDQMIAAAMEGLLHPLDNIIGEDYWDQVDPRAAKVREQFRSPVDQKYYGFVAAYGGWDEGMLMAWNKNLFEREGLPNLYELYEQGEWTWDKFLEIAVDATKDTSGDGEIDQWGYGPSRNWGPGTLVTDVLAQFVFSNNGDAIIKEDGDIKFGLDQEETMEALRFVKKLYTDTEATVPVGSFNPTTSFPDGNIAMISMEEPKYRVDVIRQEGMEEGYGLVPMPKGPNSDEHVSISGPTFVVSIPITEKKPEALFHLHNKLFQTTKEHMQITWEEEHKEQKEEDAMRVCDEKSLEIFQWSRDNVTPSVSFSEFFIPGLENLAEKTLMEDESVSATVDAIKPSVEQYLEEKVN